MIEDEEFKRFISRCLLPYQERPSATELLLDPFLAKADDETEKQPIKLNKNAKNEKKKDKE